MRTNVTALRRCLCVFAALRCVRLRKKLLILHKIFIDSSIYSSIDTPIQYAF